MVGWEQALDTFASRAGGALRWMLVGSSATRVQGAAVDPGDVDILVHPETSDSDLTAITAALMPYAATHAVSDDPDHFLSTPDQPLVATPDGTWLLGRWIIAGCKLEVARIRVDLEPTTIIETLGIGVWDTRRTVPWRGHHVPVVPLEVQLATMLSRGLDQRASAVRAHLDANGLDEALLAQAFNDRGIR